MPSNILVIEDEPAISELISVNLQHAGHCAIRAYNAEQAQSLISDVLPDLVLLDWMLPGKSGIAFARDLRNNERTKHIPIIMLTARGQEVDKVVGLELGADDYVTKPFSIRELLARVKAVLRRTSVVPKDQDRRSFGEVEVDLRKCRVLKSGKAIDISSKEFELLKYFIVHSGETLSRDRLLEDVWGYDNYPTTRTVDTHLVRLRQKLEPNPDQPQYFLTVHGTGYRFVG